ncbi:unnamed protein product [Vicia faba]|uniref:Uncharacterized protein n=1 Tax=Vicia faba TaxID=3906 RepID=A0AAV0ZRJ3_VICFA|nr:unnamed protein product [Vicia faba]
MEHCNNFPKTSLFFSSFIQFLLELSGITSTDARLVKALELVDTTAISLMCYYKDKNKEYYFLQTDAHEDWLIGHIEAVEKEAEEGREKMKEEIKAELKANEVLRPAVRESDRSAQIDKEFRRLEAEGLTPSAWMLCESENDDVFIVVGAVNTEEISFKLFFGLSLGLRMFRDPQLNRQLNL